MTQTILIVDALEEVHDHLKFYAKTFGAGTFHARNGPDGIHLWEANRCDVGLVFLGTNLGDAHDVYLDLKVKDPDILFVVGTGFDHDGSEKKEWVNKPGVVLVYAKPLGFPAYTHLHASYLLS